MMEGKVKKLSLSAVVLCAALGVLPASAQVKQTREQIMFYTSD